MGSTASARRVGTLQGFGDDVIAAALVDRLLHYCRVVNIRGNSYRLRHHAELWTTLNSPADSADGLAKQRRKTKRRVSMGLATLPDD